MNILRKLLISVRSIFISWRPNSQPERQPFYETHSTQRSGTPNHVPTDDELADRWISAHPLTKYGLGTFRRYDSGVWKEIPDETVEGEILQVLEDAKRERFRPTASKLKSVNQLASAKIYVPSELWDSHTSFIPCRNGAYDTKSHTLLPHVPEYYFTSGLEFDYDPEAKCPVFQYVLKTTIPDEAGFLQEFAGYALTTDTSLETAVWLYGPPGSGKSTIIGGLQSTFGPRSGILGLSGIERSNFALTNIIGKTLLVSTEQPQDSIKTSHLLNAIISGEPIEIDRKYKDPVTMTPRAKILWAMNDLPALKSANNGLFRRVRIIEFPPLPENTRNTTLKAKIAQEGPGILNWAIEGLVRLQKRGGFAVPASVSDATTRFHESQDVVAAFVADVCEIDSWSKTQASLLYQAYSDWCRRNGHKPLSSTKLAIEWRRLGFHRAGANGLHYWGGLRIKQPR